MTLVLTQAYTLLDVATSRNTYEGKVRKYSLKEISNPVKLLRAYWNMFLSKYVLNT